MKCLIAGLRACLFLTLGSTIVHAAPKIGLLVTDQSFFWQNVEKGARTAADAANVRLVVKTAPNTSGGMQARLAAALVEEQLDVLIVNPGPTIFDQLKAPITTAVAKGIRVVAIDNPMPDGIPATFIGHDQTAMIDAAAEIFIGTFADGDEVAILRVPNVPSFTFREKRMLELIRKKRGASKVHIDIFASPSAKEEDHAAQSKVLLHEHPHVKAVFTSFSTATIGMLAALNETGQGGRIKLVGFGVSLNPAIIKAVEEGVLQGWIAQNPREMGRKAVEVAASLGEGKPVAATHNVDFIVVTKDNVQNPKTQTLLD